MLRSLRSLFFPYYCEHCGRLLLQDEQVLCLTCQSQLPRLYAGRPGNTVEAHLFGRIDYVHATSFFRYTREHTHLLQDAKYHRRPYNNQLLARLFAAELRADGWPHDIDLLVPVPIHWYRRLTRGYNQAYYVAAGLADVWQLPLSDCLTKRRYTTTQVHQDYQDRLEHVRDSFGVRHPERLAHRHLLLVDDVLTSGATLEACAHALRQVVPDVRISILTLAFAHV